MGKKPPGDLEKFVRQMPNFFAFFSMVWVYGARKASW